MGTVNELKTDFVNHLATLELPKMSLVELGAYADLLRKADDLFKPSYTDYLMNGFNSPFGAIMGKKEAK
jgi:hypothetical protein